MLVFKSRRVKCKNCDTIFTTKKKTHLYCCRECYLKCFLNKEEEGDGFPQFVCYGCGLITKLTFNPVAEPLRWLNFKCPECGYVNKDNDYGDVMEIKNKWKEFGKIEK
jgi:hypothetical protein